MKMKPESTTVDLTFILISDELVFILKPPVFMFVLMKLRVLYLSNLSQ